MHFAIFETIFQISKICKFGKFDFFVFLNELAH